MIVTANASAARVRVARGSLRGWLYQLGLIAFLAFGLLSAPSGRASIAQTESEIEGVEDAKSVSSSLRVRLSSRARLRGASGFEVARIHVPKQLGTVAVRRSEARARPRWSLPRRMAPTSDDDEHDEV
jgi:hypothetical protein